MPTSRHCTNCGNRHAAPTGKKCAVVAARLNDAQQDSNLCEAEIRLDLDNRTSSSPVGSPVQQQEEFTSQVNIPKSMNLLADNLVLLRKEMADLRSEVKVIRQNKPSHSDSWLELQGVHNASLNNVNQNDLISAPLSRVPPLPQQTRSQSQVMPPPAPVTVNTLRSNEYGRRTATAQYEQLERDSTTANCSGDFNLGKRSVKSGRERTGGDDARRIYVKWPQEACFIGPERKRVRYDELDHPQWVSGIITIASEEQNTQVQSNMFKYLASLNQDVVDFGFQASKGAHSLILSHIEEGKATWDDLPMIQALRESYTYRSQSVAPHATKPVRIQAQTKMGSDRVRICRNYNTGACLRGASHVSNGIQYNHFCNFCHRSGAKSPHTEMECKKKLSATKSGSGDLV